VVVLIEYVRVGYNITQIERIGDVLFHLSIPASTFLEAYVGNKHYSRECG
jgi:hypothetical protein